MPKSRDLLARLDTANLPKLIPRLSPEVLHRAIQARGLEDSAEFVALATPAQLARILDADVWSGEPGGDERFDVERFGVWLAVLMQAGVGIAAEKIVGLDINLIASGFSRHLAVFDQAAVAAFATLDGELMSGRDSRGDATAEIGGYRIEARRMSAWDAIVDLLVFLEVEHAEHFHRLMRGCVQLSSGPREEDGCHALLDDLEQDLFDVTSKRDVRREAKGYVTAADARAFLQSARAVVRPDDDASIVVRDHGDTTAIELRRGGFGLLQQYITSHPASGEELAYLANVLVAGCSIQGRAFTPTEAKNAAMATANLGLEAGPGAGRGRNLVGAFQAGWSLLHRDVSMYAARRLMDTIAQLHCDDRVIHLSLQSLRRELSSAVRDGRPSRARNALDAILMLDAPCWAILAALIAECPALHAAIRASEGRASIEVTDCEFISQRSHIAVVHGFLNTLPERLLG